MKLSEITAIRAQAGPPALLREQLLELTGTRAGKRFEAAHISIDDGDRQARDVLKATVRILAAKTFAAANHLAMHDELVTQRTSMALLRCPLPQTKNISHLSIHYTAAARAKVWLRCKTG